MRKATCQVCNTQAPAQDMLALDQTIQCLPCAEKQFEEAKSAGREIKFSRITDPTICNLCRTDYGNSDLPFIAGVPVCANCAKGLYEHPYPQWLKLSLAGLLLLLAVSLWRGAPYFNAGRHLVLAQRAMDKNDYKKATVDFAEVLKTSPTEQRIVLLGAKASLMAGDIDGAAKFFKQRESYETNDLFTEVNGLWNRALDAYKKAEKAAKLAEENKDEEAARLMHEASSEYPQSTDLLDSALTLDSNVAFQHKDYDAFLKISQSNAEQRPDDPVAVAGVASALACKYAVTGNQEFRKQAEETLEKAQRLVPSSPEAKERLARLAERTHFRLETREIIDPAEYERRFGKKEAKR